MRDVATELKTINSVIEDGPFAATWESPEDYRVPKWYRDAKFGVFIHWGVYSVPAFGNEWYPRNMYLQDNEAFAHHREHWGDHTKFGYKDFIPLFKAERFDAEAWADVFADAGAKYVVPVAEHHDGFAMYDSGFSKWCAARMGPKRDIMGELAAATRERGMVFGVSTHREEHCWFFNGGRDVEVDTGQGIPYHRPSTGAAVRTRMGAQDSVEAQMEGRADGLRASCLVCVDAGGAFAGAGIERVG